MKRREKIIFRKILPLFFLFIACIFLFGSSFLKSTVTPSQSLPLETSSASESALFSPEHLSVVPTQSSGETIFSSLEYLGSQLPSPEATQSATLIDQPTTAPEFCLDVPVILYHHIQPLELADQLGHKILTVDSKIFDEQMYYLVTAGYTSISAEDLVNALLTYQQLPQKSIVITIDDGYDDNYTYAFLVAKKYQLVMNFMIPSGLIDKPGYMIWDHLKEMNESPYAKIYNHTTNHSALGLLSKEKIEEELATSSAAFKAYLGLDNTVFTYPYGSFSPLAIEELKKHEFSAAFTTMAGRRQCRSEIMTLHRDHIGNAPLSMYGL